MFGTRIKLYSVAITIIRCRGGYVKKLDNTYKSRWTDVSNVLVNYIDD